MSADNVLVILQNKSNQIAVYDVGFSWISTNRSWRDVLTKEDSEVLTKTVLGNPHVHLVKEFPRGTKLSEVGRFCRDYMENNLVEYGYRNIIVHH